MCLITKKNKLSKAWWNKTVYKVVRVKENGDWYSPVMNTRIFKGVLMESDLIIEDTVWLKKYSVDIGLHAYTSFSEALESKRWWERLHNVPHDIILSKIPKGAYYIKGVNNQIASNRLIVGK